MHTMLRDDAWQRIRALRSRPPGLAAREEERLRVFGAALQQSEELFGAAAAVSEAAKPLPLFYGVSQAGREIAAAHNRTLGSDVASCARWRWSSGSGIAAHSCASVTGPCSASDPRACATEEYASLPFSYGRGVTTGAPDVVALGAYNKPVAGDLPVRDHRGRRQPEPIPRAATGKGQRRDARRQ